MFPKSFARGLRVFAAGAAALATLGLPFAVPAPAGAAPAPPREVVPINDLDLTNPEDQRMLDQRIRRAARAVCAGHRPPNAIADGNYWRCLHQATAGAESQRQKLARRAQLSARAAGPRAPTLPGKH